MEDTLSDKTYRNDMKMIGKKVNFNIPITFSMIADGRIVGGDI